MNKTLSLIVLFLLTGTLMAQQPTSTPQSPEAKVTRLMSRELTELPGKEVEMITVEYSAGQH